MQNSLFAYVCYLATPNRPQPLTWQPNHTCFGQNCVMKGYSMRIKPLFQKQQMEFANVQRDNDFHLMMGVHPVTGRLPVPTLSLSVAVSLGKTFNLVVVRGPGGAGVYGRLTSVRLWLQCSLSACESLCEWFTSTGQSP